VYLIGSHQRAGVVKHMNRRRAARSQSIARILGLFNLLLGVTMLVPIVVSLWFDDGEFYHFVSSAAFILGFGLLLWFPTRNAVAELRRNDSFIIVVFFWVGLGLLGALPFILGPHLDFVDSLFEAISGLTTTGATVLVGLDELPPSILFYRQQLQWLGGAGVILLAIAVLPLIGIGGMQLYRAEVPGPEPGDKLAPRIAKTARSLWVVYLVLTIACAGAYRLSGMSTFDAIAHSLTTVSTGGFSTHDANLGYFESASIELVAQLFMILGAISYAVHFRVWRRGRLRLYSENAEVRAFLAITAGTIVLVSGLLWAESYYPSFGESLRHGSFHVVSAITTTGYTTTGFAGWPLALPVICIFASFIGGCAGSTAGGMKVIRTILLWKQGMQELKSLIHPTAVMAIKIGQQRESQALMISVWAFFSLYALTFTILMVLMMMAGHDQVTSFSAIATSMNNLGPGLGDINSNFRNITDAGKLICIYAMLLGRLEIFTLLVLLTPEFWRR
jgi:trk system potassium uptake protein TrkH